VAQTHVGQAYFEAKNDNAESKLFEHYLRRASWAEPSRLSAAESLMDTGLRECGRKRDDIRLGGTTPARVERDKIDERDAHT
jgi:hypothetical protein